MTSTIIRPIINNNGTSIDDLIQPRLDAREALREAIDALLRVTPNGRDYPGTGGVDKCVADRDLHYARIKALAAIGDDLMAEAVSIKTQR
jgi:hypothetical protein